MTTLQTEWTEQELLASHPGRLEVIHHLDAEHQTAPASLAHDLVLSNEFPEHPERVGA